MGAQERLGSGAESVRQRLLQKKRQPVDAEQGLRMLERLKQVYMPNHEVARRAEPGACSQHYIITNLKARFKRVIDDPTIDLTVMHDDYNIYLSDGTIGNPFVISRELMGIIRAHTRPFSTQERKARAVFDWIEQNIEYGASRRNGGYADTSEVLKNRQGICGEMAFLYITMARSVSLRSAYVSVKKDCFGKEVQHGCAIVDIGERDVLADPAYHAFDVAHKEFQVLSDREVIARYSQWRGLQ